ncbi:MAG: TetR family transcriptional regulator [Actinomycetota bacterium]
MCSAANFDADASVIPAVDARQRIIVAAIDLVGSDGSRAATVRRVAEAAAVSPALVMHHFGSKAGLFAACDEAVMATIGRAVDALSADDRDAGFVELLAEESAGPAMSYIGRVLHDGGDNGRQWFDWMIDLTRDGMATLAAAGRARPAEDPQMQAVLLLTMDLGVVLLRQHVERYLGGTLTDDDVTTRWAVAELDLLTNGVLVDATNEETKGDVDE